MCNFQSFIYNPIDFVRLMSMIINREHIVWSACAVTYKTSSKPLLDDRFCPSLPDRREPRGKKNIFRLIPHYSISISVPQSVPIRMKNEKKILIILADTYSASDHHG